MSGQERKESRMSPVEVLQREFHTLCETHQVLIRQVPGPEWLEMSNRVLDDIEGVRAKIDAIWIAELEPPATTQEILKVPAVEETTEMTAIIPVEDAPTEVLVGDSAGTSNRNPSKPEPVK